MKKRQDLGQQNYSGCVPACGMRGCSKWLTELRGREVYSNMDSSCSSQGCTLGPEHFVGPRAWQTHLHQTMTFQVWRTHVSIHHEWEPTACQYKDQRNQTLFHHDVNVEARAHAVDQSVLPTLYHSLVALGRFDEPDAPATICASIAKWGDC